MKTIELTQGYTALVDDDDFERVAQFKWYPRIDHSGKARTIYAHRRDGSSLHRFILGITDSETHVDHKDHNGLNCQKNNMRRVTQTQNNFNARKRRDNTSGVKGVYWDKDAQKWKVQININKRRTNLGRFTSLEEAKHVSYAALLKYHGEFAHVD